MLRRTSEQQRVGHQPDPRQQPWPLRHKAVAVCAAASGQSSPKSGHTRPALLAACPPTLRADLRQKAAGNNAPRPRRQNKRGMSELGEHKRAPNRKSDHASAVFQLPKMQGPVIPSGRIIQQQSPCGVSSPVGRAIQQGKSRSQTHPPTPVRHIPTGWSADTDRRATGRRYPDRSTEQG